MIKKREFKALLNELLEKELENLRKRFRPYKRRSFLSNKVIIDLDFKCTDKNVLGYYTNTQENEDQWRFTHNIFITKLSKDNYQHYVKWGFKKMAIDNLKSTIRHELIHAFVCEEFDMFGDIKNCNGDYSPIFLSCLYWANEEFCHPYTDKFKNTELYKQISQCNKYDTIQIHLTHYIFDLEKTVRTINKKLNSDGVNYRNLKIEFNQRGAGIRKRSYVSMVMRTKENNKLCLKKATEMTLGIGFLVTPKDIIENYERKFNNGSIAQLHSEIAAYVVHDEFKNKSIIRES